jgi:hypothetical protein
MPSAAAARNVRVEASTAAPIFRTRSRVLELQSVGAFDPVAALRSAEVLIRVGYDLMQLRHALDDLFSGARRAGKPDNEREQTKCKEDVHELHFASLGSS